MKKVFFILLITPFVILAQTPSPHVYHATLGSAVAKKGFELNFNYRYNKNNFTFHTISYTEKAKNIPLDFVPSHGGLFNSTGSLPEYEMNTLGLTYAYSLKIPEIPIYFIPKVGMAYNRIKNPENYQPYIEPDDNGGGGMGIVLFETTPANYTYETISQKNVGLVINPTIQIIISQANAISFGIISNMNNGFNYTSFEILFDFGYLRDKKPKTASQL